MSAAFNSAILAPKFKEVFQFLEFSCSVPERKKAPFKAILQLRGKSDYELATDPISLNWKSERRMVKFSTFSKISLEAPC